MRVLGNDPRRGSFTPSTAAVLLAPATLRLKLGEVPVKATPLRRPPHGSFFGSQLVRAARFAQMSSLTAAILAYRKTTGATP